MGQILHDIIEFFVIIRSGIGSFFKNITLYLLLIIIIDGIIIIILILRYKRMQKLQRELQMQFDQHIDNMYYQTSLMIAKHKDTIHNFDSAVTLLFNYKTAEIEKGSQANYQTSYKNLMQEAEYIAELVGEPLQVDKPEIDNQYNNLTAILNIMSKVKTSISFLSLGLGKLFI